MKVKVIADAWYDNHYFEIGDIADIKEKKVPLWAELIEKKEPKQVKVDNADKTEVNEPKQVETDNTDKNEVNDEEAEKELETLKDIGIENGLMFDIPETLSTKEKIDFIKNELIKCGIEL